MREWLFLIHPFDPFPTVIFILKDSFPQKFYIYPVWETRVKIWNNKIQMVNFQNGDDAKRDFKAILCLTALHLCAMPSRIFFVVFQLWQPVGNQRAAILIFVIHIYNRKDDLDLTSSGQSQWLTGCKRLWTVFLDRPVLNQMAAEMEKCCQLQALSPMHRSCSFRHCFSSIWFLFMNVLK